MTAHLSLVPVGRVRRAILDELAGDLEGRFPWPVRVPATRLNPGPTFNRERGQFHATHLLDLLDIRADADAVKVLGVGDLDLFIPVLTFVFGEARLGGRTAVLGLTRLRPEVYGLPPDPARFRARILREAVHEIGHTLSLVHCSDPSCVMASSVTADAVDTKYERFCARCAAVARAAEIR